MSGTKKTKGVLIKVKDLQKDEWRAALEKAIDALLGNEDDKPEKKPSRKRPKKSG